MPPSSCSGICSVSRRSVSGSYSTTAGLPLTEVSNRTAQWVGLCASLVDLLDDGRCGFAALAVLLQLLDLGGFVSAVGVGSFEPQRPLDRHLIVAEGGIVEDLALLVFLRGEESVADALDVRLAELAVFLAQVLAQRPVPLGGVDQLHLALAMLWLAVGEHPDVGGDAGVVEHVERQGDDCLQPVVLDDPAADVALALAGVAGEQGAAVVYLGDAAAARLHLGQLVGEEEHLAVAGAGD